jgi:hypothetical protein
MDVTLLLLVALFSVWEHFRSDLDRARRGQAR